ncbi:MAG TPA: DUF1236 domain-containing protein [Pseudolabrys sp.]|nr:DUF1236 domain-containing protein [Pseudolabrys sp.]
MRKTKLLSTVAMALLLGVGTASAQGMSKEPPERAPAAQQKAPAEKVAPSMKSDHKSPQTTGQAAPDSKAPGKAHETTGQSPKSENPGKAGAMDKDKSGAPGNSDSRSKSEQSERSKSEQNGASSKSTQSTTEQSRSTTTGQGAAAGSAKLSAEQRTKITSIIKQHKVAPTKLSVSVSIGTRIPASVHLYPLPVQVVEVYPEWRGFNYILVGDQIVVIDPRTHEIVAVLAA